MAADTTVYHSSLVSASIKINIHFGRASIKHIKHIVYLQEYVFKQPFSCYYCLFTFWKEPTPASINRKQHNNPCQEQHTKTSTSLVNESTPMSTYVFHRAPLLLVASATPTCRNKYQVQCNAIAFLPLPFAA